MILWTVLYLYDVFFLINGEAGQYFLIYLTLLVPQAEISAFAPRAKSAASRYIGSSVDHN
jgi:hypothetical protein